jgi:hypothetical protein
MLVIALEIPVPEADRLNSVARETFELRRTSWPPPLPPPPLEWAGAWAGFRADFGATAPLPWPDLDAAYVALAGFWEPLLSGTGGRWDSDQWSWSQPSPTPQDPMTE